MTNTKLIFRMFILKPMFIIFAPFAALGYWAGSETATYWEALKEVIKL